jgi:glycosyltransferase involved in cell wall biosynthesis
MEVRKVLVITYYWPPTTNSGVHRCLKFVKYLPKFGWKPFVFTPKNPSFVTKDESLVKNIPDDAEIIRFPIWEPYDLFLKFSSFFNPKKVIKPADVITNSNSSFFQKISTWVRGNFFIPDPRKFWIKPSVKFLTKFLKENNINTVITTGPPHSMHLIAYQLKKKDPSLRWIADFRDPWSEWQLLDNLKLSYFARKRHQQLEYQVLTTADEIVTVTPFFAGRFERISNRKVHVITNGYDEDDFKNLKYTKQEYFSIIHVGVLFKQNDPRVFFEAVKELMDEDDAFRRLVRIEFVGDIFIEYKLCVENTPDLKKVVVFTNTIPHHELIEKYGSVSLLLMILTHYTNAEGYIPGKLFEYLATGLPVLGLGPVKGEAASILQDMNAGKMVSGAAKDDIKKSLYLFFKHWVQAGGSIERRDTSKYTRQELTRRLVDLLA